ncbi:redoxin domain-containing protein [Ralstonia pickettii]|uniref:Redoxin domain-containing protein n=1 Tax=Ralstonia pickettii TaxID=329 RepID=A0A7X2HK95_RALPI|nr:redoxin domain-containing protein [Ralstonia pickettii]
MTVSRRLWVGLVLLFVIGAGIAASVLTQRHASPAITFRTLDGRRIALQDLRGRVVVVTFWATSCSICVEEMPDLAQTYRQYRARGFELIAVAMAYDAPDEVRNFARVMSLPFPIVLDTGGALAHAFSNTTVVPTTFVIDRSGQLVSKTLGAIDPAKLRQYLDAS